jgi:hypothetical protein
MHARTGACPAPPSLSWSQPCMHATLPCKGQEGSGQVGPGLLTCWLEEAPASSVLPWTRSCESMHSCVRHLPSSQNQLASREQRARRRGMIRRASLCQRLLSTWKLMSSVSGGASAEGAKARRERRGLDEAAAERTLSLDTGRGQRDKAAERSMGGNGRERDQEGT